LTSTIDVDQHWRRHRPVRAKRTSSSPNAVTVPMRSPPGLPDRSSPVGLPRSGRWSRSTTRPGTSRSSSTTGNCATPIAPAARSRAGRPVRRPDGPSPTPASHTTDTPLARRESRHGHGSVWRAGRRRRARSRRAVRRDARTCVAFVSTGAPEDQCSRNHRFSEPLYRARWDPPTRLHPAQIRSAGKLAHGTTLVTPDLEPVFGALPGEDARPARYHMFPRTPQQVPSGRGIVGSTLVLSAAGIAVLRLPRPVDGAGRLFSSRY
jgi:hypothetical protein